MHTHTDGSLMNNGTGVGAGIHPMLFSHYICVGEDKISSFIAKIQRIHFALQQLIYRPRSLQKVGFIVNSKQQS